MKVRELLDAWVHHSGEVAVSFWTIGNPYGDDIRWSGNMKSASISGFVDSRVVGFSVEYADGVNMIIIHVDAHSVPIYLLKGEKYLTY